MSSVEEQAAEIIKRGKEAAEAKGQRDPLSFDNSDQATNKILKSATASLNASDDPLKGPAASAAAKKNTDLSDEVKKQIEAEKGDGAGTGNSTDSNVHERVAQQLVDGVNARLERMPFEKVKETVGDQSEPSEEVAKRLLKEGERAVGREALQGREVQEGVKGSGIVAGSDAAVAQSAVDRLQQEGHVAPAAEAAIKILAAQIDAAREKARDQVQGEKAVDVVKPPQGSSQPTPSGEKEEKAHDQVQGEEAIDEVDALAAELQRTRAENKAAAQE